LDEIKLTKLSKNFEVNERKPYMSLIKTFFKSVFSAFYGCLFFGIILSEILSGCLKQAQPKKSTVQNSIKDNSIKQTRKDKLKAIVIAQVRQKLLKSFYFIACLLYGDELKKYIALAKQVCLDNKLARCSAEFAQLVKSGNRLLRSYVKTAES
jgi:hypothetical protein